MHLISALASGVTGAENGTASIYRRGTATPTTWYEDFEGAGPKTGDVTLDLHGGAEVYVNELVTVTVRDLDGGAVRTFTAGVDAPAVEVKSQSFTGTNYETAITGAGEPTTLQKVLDGWFDSAGAVDFQVLVNGNPTSISTFSDLVTENVFNVQDEAYGATGDGTTDDASSVQAAINAADAAGGGIVFFPPGTYFLGSALTLADGAKLRGFSSDVSILLQDASAVTTLITLPASSRVAISDLAMRPDDSSGGASGSIIRCDGELLSLERVELGSRTGTNVIQTCVDINGGRLSATECTFNLCLEGADLYSGIDVAVNAELRCYDSTFAVKGTWTSGANVGSFVITESSSSGSSGVFVGCLFDPTTSTAALYCMSLLGGVTEKYSCIGCSFLNGAPASTIYSVRISEVSSLVHVGTRFGSLVIPSINEAGGGSVDNPAHIIGRASTRTIDSGSPMDVQPSIFEIQWIDVDPAAITLNVDSDTNPIFGQRFTLIISDVAGGTTVTFGSDFVTNSGTSAVGAGDTKVFEFICDGNNWLEISAAVDVPA